MSQDSVQLSRRQVLAAVGGIGAVGAVAGAGTGAYLSDRERVTTTIATGAIAIDVDCDACAIVDDQLSFVFDGIDRGESDTIAMAFTVETNPARLWLRTTCPPASDPLGDALSLELDVDGDTIAAGSLSAVARSLATGVQLDDCIEPGRPIDLELTWELPAHVPDSLAGKTTAFTAELAAEQCRHVDSEGARNPFAGAAPCDEPLDCVSCPRQGGERIAEATFEYDGPDVEAHLELVRGGRAIEPGQTVKPGETITTVFHDPPQNKGNSDVDIVVDGTTIGDVHISCSEPFGPGLEISDGTYSLTVREAFDTDGSPLCEVTN